MTGYGEDTEGIGRRVRVRGIPDTQKQVRGRHTRTPSAETLETATPGSPP